MASSILQATSCFLVLTNDGFLASSRTEPWNVVRHADFITIDCGIADGRTYHAEKAGGLVYVSDAGFTDAGLKAMVRPPYDDKDKPGMAERYRTVRYFPDDDGAAAGSRSCYTLRPVTPGGKYLIRAQFYYGNYDGRRFDRLPAFDIHLGVNRWAAVNVTAVDGVYIHEAVAVSPADFLQVSIAASMSVCVPLISNSQYIQCFVDCSF